MKSRLISIFHSWIPTSITLIAIMILSLMPRAQLGNMLETYDILKHSGAYFVLSVLMFYPFYRRYNFSILKTSCLIIIICSVIGTVLEIAQYGVDGRTPNVSDGVSNVIGATLAQIVICIFLKRSRSGQDEC